jgi:hypothetical protein
MSWNWIYARICFLKGSRILNPLLRPALIVIDAEDDDKIKPDMVDDQEVEQGENNYNK